MAIALIFSELLRSPVHKPNTKNYTEKIFSKKKEKRKQRERERNFRIKDRADLVICCWGKECRVGEKRRVWRV